MCLVNNNCIVNLVLQYVGSNGLYENGLENGWLEEDKLLFVLRLEAGLGKYTLHIVLYGKLG